MKCIEIEIPGGPEVLKCVEKDRPNPGVGEVLIEVIAAGVNRPDTLQRKGLYPPPAGASPIPGLEVSGKIVAVGPGVDTWKSGDLVCALVAGGGYAEFCVVPSVQCLPIPERVSPLEAAGIPETFFTVWANVFMRGGLKAGESILIHGGSSGIGTTAIQLARAFGARVFTTAGSDLKCKACIGLGAEAAIQYRTQDFVSEVRRMTEGRGVDLILDMVGGDYFQKNIEVLAPEGRLVQIATQKGEQVNLSLRAMMSKGVSITGSTLRPRSVEQKGKIAAQLFEKVWPLFATGQLKVQVDSTFPLADASKAHQRMESGENIGKIILITRDP